MHEKRFYNRFKEIGSYSDSGIQWSLHVWPPFVRDHQSKTPFFPSQIFMIRTTHRLQPLLTSDCDHILAWRFYYSPFCFPSCKQTLDAWCDLCIRHVYLMLLRVKQELSVRQHGTVILKRRDSLFVDSRKRPPSPHILGTHKQRFFNQV